MEFTTALEFKISSQPQNMVVFVPLENLHRSEGRVKNFYPSIQSMEVLFTDVRLEFLSENVRPAIFLFPFRAVPASVFLHIITIRCQAVCKHHAAFAIGLFVQIVPLSVHEYPAALHACLRIKIEPAAISAVADPSGRCVAVLAESPPVSIDRNPLMRSSNCIISGCSCPGTFAVGCSLRIGSVFVEELITSVVVYPVAESIMAYYLRQDKNPVWILFLINSGNRFLKPAWKKRSLFR